VAAVDVLIGDAVALEHALIDVSPPAVSPRS
jgi:hypothetical protein